MATDREILARIARQPNQAAGFKQLVREFKLGGGEERRLDRPEQLEATVVGNYRMLAER